MTTVEPQGGQDMGDKYRVDPDFVVPEPTAATFHAFFTEEEYSDELKAKTIERWRTEGVKQMRFTIVNDQYPHDPYPHGIWLEGWTDERARMLPFGEAEGPDKGCSPPLVAAQP